jgi:hypothetical protein
MAIYEITVSQIVIVESDNLTNAIAYAESHGRDFVDNDGLEIGHIRKIENLNEITPPWNGDCLPYGEETSDKTLRELLK